MSKAYYGSRFSPNKTMTPEGYLICHNVPIGRTGWQEYMPDEVEGKSGNTPAQLYRDPKEVFSPAAIASFENKPLTDEHPPSWLQPDNVSAYMKGVVSNVRQGKDDESDLLLADLTVYNPNLISEINAGKREISCGYDYDCNPIEGQDNKFTQNNIRGNHVAIVREGRAGSRVAVKDAKPKNIGGKKMPKLDKDTIWGKMFKAFAQDAEPEELAAASQMHGEKKATDAEGGYVENVKPQASSVAGKDDVPPVTQPSQEGKIIELLNNVVERLTALEQSDKEVHAAMPKPKSALDDLAEELGETPQEQQQEVLAGGVEPTDPDDEAAVTIDPEQLQDEAPVSSPEDRPKNTIPGADSRAAIRMALNIVRQEVAAIKDPVQRRSAEDRVAKKFREQLVPSGTNPMNAYQKLTKPAKPQAQDSANEDPAALGEQWKMKFNPHYKNKGVK
jgi:hypothetical protein